MNNNSRSAPSESPRPFLPRPPETQLELDLGDGHIPPGPDWGSLPEPSRTEAVTLLARLLAKAGAAEEESDV